MAERIITCINCPMGCRMTVTLDADGAVTAVAGNTCVRGDRYARQEVTAPVRMVTAVVPVAGCVCPLSVKTREPIPKPLIPACMEALRALRLSLPVKAGDVVLPDVCGTGVDVIATRSLPGGT